LFNSPPPLSYDRHDQQKLEVMGRHDVPYFASGVIVASPSSGDTPVSKYVVADVTAIVCSLVITLVTLLV